MSLISNYFSNIALDSTNHHAQGIIAQDRIKLVQRDLIILNNQLKQNFNNLNVFLNLPEQLFTKIESDFLSDLNEGDIVLTIVAPQGSRLSVTTKIAQNFEKIISQNPQIDKTFARIDYSQSALDPMPQNIGDIFIIIKIDQNINAKLLSKNYFNKNVL